MTMTLDQLWKKLDQHEHAVPIDELVRLMKGTKLTLDEVRHCVRYDDEHYTRNLLHHGPGYVAIILCWANGQASPIHDHAGSACGVKVVHGECTEEIYRRNDDGRLRPVKTNTYEEGLVCGSYDSDTHVLRNVAADGRGLVTLHIYTPPLKDIHIYDADTGEVEIWTDTILEDARNQMIAARAR